MLAQTLAGIESEQRDVPCIAADQYAAYYRPLLITHQVNATDRFRDGIPRPVFPFSELMSGLASVES